MTARLAYTQVGGVEAVTDRLQIEDQWGAGQTGIVTPDSFRVTTGGGSTPMSITVSAGRAVIYSDVPFNGSYYVADDEDRLMTLGASASSGSGQYRRDAVVARVRDASLVSSDGASSFGVEVIQGSNTASNNPPLPALPDRTLLICDVVVNPGSTGPSKITDRRLMVKPREYVHQATLVQASTVVVNQSSYTNVNGLYLPNWPDWCRRGGHRCFHKITSTARVLTASDALLRAILGEAMGDPKVASVNFPQKLYSPGMFTYLTSGEYIIPRLDTPFSTLQAQRVGTAATAMSFETQQSVTTHEIRIFESPS